MSVGLLLAVGGRTTLWRSIDTPSFTIGRNPECDLSVPDETVAPVQCVLQRDGQLIVLVNHADSGTTVGEDRIKVEARLAEGDAIQLGPVIATVRYSGRTANDTGTRTLVRDSGAKAGAGIVLKLGERTYEINRRGVTIGSDPSNDVVVTDPYVSSFHARVSLEDGRCMVHDVGSRNGVFIGEQKVHSAEVMPPATIKIGRVDAQVLRSGLEVAVPESTSGVDYVGVSSVADDLRTVTSRMATNDAPVLIIGETGTGKEVAARLIGTSGARAGKPFVALNCGALSRSLIESELFGHEKGAFTGAEKKKLGVFEQANGGTLFLDEIGELPLDLQPQLLRVLETGIVRRVGGVEDIPVRVRVVSATNRRLEDEVIAGRFREDLFHRLHVLSVEMTPLREHAEDIVPLVQHFLKQFVPNGGAGVTFDDAALKKLRTHVWPGNTRELRNVIQRAVLMRGSDTLSAKDVVFPPNTSKNLLENRAAKAKTLADIERAAIVSEIVRQKGNKGLAADALQISRSTIHRKVEEYEIDIEAELEEARNR